MNGHSHGRKFLPFQSVRKFNCSLTLIVCLIFYQESSYFIRFDRQFFLTSWDLLLGQHQKILELGEERRVRFKAFTLVFWICTFLCCSSYLELGLFEENWNLYSFVHYDRRLQIARRCKVQKVFFIAYTPTKHQLPRELKEEYPALVSSNVF